MKTIKLSLALLFVAVAATSCNDDPVVNSTDDTEFRIKVIDGCEYVYYDGVENGFMAHKGDCKNPIHCHNK